MTKKEKIVLEWLDGTRIKEISPSGTFWRRKGQLHRENGPAREWADGLKEWWVNGKLHREDGPAREWADGYKEWWINNQRHREDGPAVERTDGTKSWWINNQRHREDGPAVEYANGTKEWWINDEKLTKGEFLKRKKTPCDGKVVEIDGKKYKLVSI